MNTLTFTQLKKMTVTNLFPIFGKKATGHTFTREPDNKIYNMLNPEFEYNYGDVQVESPAFKQSCSLSLTGPGHCPFGGACHTCAPTIQAKLNIGQPNDKYEQEADRVAEQVMRMPEPNNTLLFQSHKNSNSHIIQKQDDNTATTQEKEDPNNSKLSLQLPQPDILSLQKPFFERKAYQLWDTDSAIAVWKYCFDFFKRFGLDSTWAGKAANFTAPFAIDVQLKMDNPTWWEITDEELQTTSRILSIPLFDFEANFNNWRPFPFLQQGSQVQRKACSSCKGKKEDEDKLIQTLAVDNTAATTQVDHPLIQNVLSSPGQPLDAATRNFMEPRFGQDFSGVRVHTSGAAAEAARAVNARAYTVGRNVVFGEGQYVPGSSEGKRLLAHELAHVGQQSRADRVSVDGRNSKSDLSSNSRAYRMIGTLPLRDARVIQRATVEDYPSNVQRDVVISFHKHAEVMLGWALGLSAHTDMKVVQDAAWRSFHVLPQNPKTKVLWNWIQGVLSSIAMHCGEAVYEFEPDQTVWDSYCVSGVIAVSLDHIHLCPRWWDVSSKDYAAAILIHEWAHKWGPGVNRVFETYCSSTDYSAMRPEDRISQPDAYANFAYQVWTGRPLSSC